MAEIAYFGPVAYMEMISIQHILSTPVEGGSVQLNTSLELNVMSNRSNLKQNIFKCLNSLQY